MKPDHVLPSAQQPSPATSLEPWSAEKKPTPPLLMALHA
eukprot:CAMPEP_0202861710 /NCGR_PEP_ID=MMETSP1391-20130828/3020_1 /ASSEMBLY_ACC=CAM_ASM_000867 /TAXON_ID=1034604 /ORGANISM="Chlamydomonas leiostraca, Strain SAG 11-49" /LENGTH=38 /DNA_ID= /DNA_START= /DNA_END= /DNA_ORIENTATION=